MTIPNINLVSGKLIFDSFFIDPAVSYENQIDELNEDLLYIKFEEYSEVDVSWLPGLDPNGRFVVRVLKNEDWDNPIYRKETRNFLKLEQYLQEAIDLAENLTKDKNFSHLMASSDSTNFEYSNFKFDRVLFKQFFNEEHIDDLESGSFYYSLQLKDHFEFTVSILAIDNFMGLQLHHKTNQIFSIGYEGITCIKLVQSSEHCFLDLYKSEISENNYIHYLRMLIKPHVEIITLVKN